MSNNIKRLTIYWLLFTIFSFYCVLCTNCGRGKKGELIEYGSLRGKIQLDGERDHSRIKVLLEGKVIVDDLTDSEGVYEFYNLPTGEYKFSAAKRGYTSYTKNIRIVPGVNPSINQTLYPSAERLIEVAWNNFTLRKYKEAISDFTRVLEGERKDKNLIEQAYTGRGWSYLQIPTATLDEKKGNISKAISDFNKALELNKNNKDAKAGKIAALAARIDEPNVNLDEIITMASELLTSDPKYFFYYDSTFTYADIHAILSVTYMAKEDKHNACLHAQKALEVEPANEWANEVKNKYCRN